MIPQVGVKIKHVSIGNTVPILFLHPPVKTRAQGRRGLIISEKKKHSNRNPSIPANQNMLQNFKLLFLKVYMHMYILQVSRYPFRLCLVEPTKNRLDIHISIEKVFNCLNSPKHQLRFGLCSKHLLTRYHLEQLIDDMGMLMVGLVERTVPNFGPYVCLEGLPFFSNLPLCNLKVRRFGTMMAAKSPCNPREMFWPSISLPNHKNGTQRHACLA